MILLRKRNFFLYITFKRIIYRMHIQTKQFLKYFFIILISYEIFDFLQLKEIIYVCMYIYIIYQN